jgi:thiol-disulfide isomerase/thioredoxin
MEELAPKPLSGLKAAALIGGIAALVYFTTRQSLPKQALGGPAPALSMIDLSGQTATLEGLKGKTVLLNFWATWCEPCQEEIPDLIALQKKYAAKGFTVVGVSMDTLGKSTVADFAKKNNINYPVWVGGGDNPPGYDVPGLPTNFLIDPKGRIISSYLGPRGEAEFARDIETVLGN